MQDFQPSADIWLLARPQTASNGGQKKGVRLVVVLRIYTTLFGCFEHGLFGGLGIAYGELLEGGGRDIDVSDTMFVKREFDRTADLPESVVFADRIIGVAFDCPKYYAVENSYYALLDVREAGGAFTRTRVDGFEVEHLARTR